MLSRTVLIFLAIDSTWCCKYSSEMLVDIDMIASQLLQFFQLHFHDVPFHHIPMVLFLSSGYGKEIDWRFDICSNEPF